MGTSLASGAGDLWGWDGCGYTVRGRDVSLLAFLRTQCECAEHCECVAMCVSGDQMGCWLMGTDALDD